MRRSAQELADLRNRFVVRRRAFCVAARGFYLERITLDRPLGEKMLPPRLPFRLLHLDWRDISRLRCFGTLVQIEVHFEGSLVDATAHVEFFEQSETS
jgi:hypothetical protein